jgi:hypothetical protein
LRLRTFWEASRVLGLRVTPPEGVTLRQWLADIQGIVRHHKYS